MLKQEYQYLLAAIQFFTRIPLPPSVAHDSVTLNQALKYFPLIGWLVEHYSYTPVFVIVSLQPILSAALLMIFVPKIRQLAGD